MPAARIRARRALLRTKVDGRWVSTAPGVSHGTAMGYGDYLCRCVRCARAWAASVRAANAQRKQRTAQTGHAVGISHGVNAYANWGCRCQICVAAARAKDRRRTPRRRQAATRPWHTPPSQA